MRNNSSIRKVFARKLLAKEAAAFSTISLPFPFPYNPYLSPARCYPVV
jgi:hypothetical protein